MLIHYSIIPYLNLLLNYTQSQNTTEVYPVLVHWTELYPMLVQYRTKPYLNTLPKYLFHGIQSKQFPQAWKITADVRFSRRRINYPRGGFEEKLKRIFSKKFHSAGNESITQLPILIQSRTHSNFAQNRKIVGSQSKSSTRNIEL